MRLGHVIALVLLVSACSKKKEEPAPAATQASGLGQAAGSGSAMAGSAAVGGAFVAPEPADKAAAEGEMAKESTKNEVAKTDEPSMQSPATKAAEAVTGDYETAAFAVIEKMALLFEASGTDCTKLAAGLKTFKQSNKDTIDRLDAQEKAMTAAQKQAFAERVMPKFQTYLARMAPALMKCQGDPAVMAALQTMPLAEKEEP